MPQPRFGRRSFIDNYFPPGLKWLIISNVAVFLLYFSAAVGCSGT